MSETADTPKPKPRPAGGGKKKVVRRKKPPEAPKTPLSIRVAAYSKSAIGQVKEVFGGISSPDGPTRRMAWIFILSIAGIIAVLVAGFALSVHRKIEVSRRAAALQAEAKKVDVLADLLDKKKTDGHEIKPSVDLGFFVAELKLPTGMADSPGSVRLAEVSLSAVCDSEATRKHIDTNIIQARSAILGAFTGLSRDDLSSREGKRKLKKKIIAKLNNWLESGEVEDLFYSGLLMN